MSKTGFHDEHDPNVKPGEYPKCPAGRYEINGIEFVGVEDGTLPSWLSDDTRGQFVRVRMLRKDEGLAPAYSASPLELSLLVQAFGAKADQLPKDKSSVEYLIKADDLIRKATKTIFVTVKNEGWVSSVEGANPPEGYYRFKVIRAMSSDKTDPPKFTVDRFTNKTLWVFYEIVGDMLGKPTMYDGYQLITTMYDGFDGHTNGIPKWALTTSKAFTSNAIRIQKFVAAYCPEVYQREWLTAEFSDYGIEEYESPITVIMDRAIKNGYAAVGQLAPRKNGSLSLDPMTLAAVEAPDIQVEEQTEGVDRPFDADVYVSGSNFATEHPKLAKFTNWIYTQAKEAFVKAPISEVDELKLSEIGQAWAQDHLPKIWLAAGLTPGIPLAKLTEEDVHKVLVEIGEEVVQQEFPFA